MKSFRRQSATVNTGSMADIAFLLLIFFLVSTTISADEGILRQLPPPCITNDCTADIAERNLLQIQLNDKQQIMVNQELIAIEDLQNIVTNFIDNNGKAQCNYCNGKQLNTLSDHPQKAVISITQQAFTKYQLFINVQDQITKAINNLRNKYAKATFNKTYSLLSEAQQNEVKKAYPFKVSEVTLVR